MFATVTNLEFLPSFKEALNHLKEENKLDCLIPDGDVEEAIRIYDKTYGGRNGTVILIHFKVDTPINTLE
jgi:ABC-type lipopolysaccharide export system ATPase subunit